MTAPARPQRERVHLALLGGFTVTVGDRAVPEAAWPTRRSAELVAALLALSDRHRLVRDQVIEALWPHLDPDAGAANLRKAAHHARLALGRAARYEREAETLAGVVMRLPGWDAALEEVRGHVALASGAVARSTERFRAAAAAFREAGQPLDEIRCAALAERPA